MKFKVVLLSLLLIGGCSYFSGTSKTAQTNVNGVIPESNLNKESPAMSITKAYEVAATRITNKMLDDTADVYEASPNTKIYIAKITKDSPELSDGLYSANRTVKEIIKGSGTYTVVYKMDDADFVLESNVSDIKTESNPTIVFKMSIKDKKGSQIRAWTINIKQMAEDKSWW